MAQNPESSDELLRSATERLADLDIVAKIIPVDHADEGVDAWLRLATPTGVRTYAVEARRAVTPNTAGLVAGRTDATKLLIVASHVPEATAAIWRSKDIHFVDVTGNMYLRWPDLVVDIRGRRRDASTRAFEVSGRPRAAFKSAGLKVVFAYLCDPDIVKLPVRAAGAASGVAHGTVQNVYRELESTGFLDSERRILHRTRQLFNQWVEGYILNLWPRLTMGRFVAADPGWWKSSNEHLRRADAQWGGETAAHYADGNLRPGRAIVYAAEIPRDLIAANRLRKADGEGNVEFRHRFWAFDRDRRKLTVPTPLIYADLIASADPRQHEAAAKLRESDEVLRRIDSG